MHIAPGAGGGDRLVRPFPPRPQHKVMAQNGFAKMRQAVGEIIDKCVQRQDRQDRLRGLSRGQVFICSGRPAKIWRAMLSAGNLVSTRTR
jgi:hypothetical protein